MGDQTQQARKQKSRFPQHAREREGEGLGMQISVQSAGLPCMKPWVRFQSHIKQGVAHACNLRGTGEETTSSRSSPVVSDVKSSQLGL